MTPRHPHDHYCHHHYANFKLSKQLGSWGHSLMGIKVNGSPSKPTEWNKTS